MLHTKSAARVVAIGILVSALSSCSTVVSGTATTKSDNAAQSTSNGPTRSSNGPTRSSNAANPAGGEAAKQAHFQQVRAADACELDQSDLLKNYGPKSGYFLKGPTTCTGLAGNAGGEGEFYIFELNLNVAFDPATDKDAKPESVGGHTLYLREFSSSSDTRSCTYNLPHERFSKYALSLRAAKAHGDQKKLASLHWPERCSAAKDYLASIAGKALQLPPRSGTPQGVVGKDPCAQKAAMIRRFPGMNVKSADATSPYSCMISLDNGTGKFEVEVLFKLDVRQTSGLGKPNPPVTIGGYEGNRLQDEFGATTKYCGSALIIKPASDATAADAHLVTVTLRSSSSDYRAPAAPASCDLADQLTNDVLAGLKS